MDFDELRDKGIIEPVTVDAVEIASLVRVARRDIATAESLLGTDYDWAFAVAYNAAFGGASIAGDGPETVTVILAATGGVMLVLSPLLAMVGKR